LGHDYVGGHCVSPVINNLACAGAASCAFIDSFLASKRCKQRHYKIRSCFKALQAAPLQNSFLLSKRCKQRHYKVVLASKRCKLRHYKVLGSAQSPQ
jgi:hypothetical protein